MVIIPGKMGICTYSPLLDKNSNSVRGVLFCEQVSEKLNYHIFQKQNPIMIPIESIQYACALNDLAAVRRMNFLGQDFDDKDYDGRTGLHLACSNGHYQIVKYLLESGLKRINPKDRYKNTPMDDAIRGNHTEVQQLLASYGGKSRKELK